jgi:hypothetical protein
MQTANAKRPTARKTDKTKAEADLSRYARDKARQWRRMANEIDKAVLDGTTRNIRDKALAILCDYPNKLGGLGFGRKQCRSVADVQDAATALARLHEAAALALSRCENMQGIVQGAQALRSVFAPDPSGDRTATGHVYPREFWAWPGIWSFSDWDLLASSSLTLHRELNAFRDTLAELRCQRDHATPATGGTAGKAEPEPDAGKLAAMTEENKRLAALVAMNQTAAIKTFTAQGLKPKAIRAGWLYNQGKPIKDIQKALGCKSNSTVQAWINDFHKNTGIPRVRRNEAKPVYSFDENRDSWNEQEEG